MTSAKLSVVGHAPRVVIEPINPEQEKYERMWREPSYRAVSPGEHAASAFLAQARPKAGAEVLDLGCGTGRGGLLLALLGGMRVTFVDFARNCLDPEIEQALTTQAHALSFAYADLEKPLPVSAEYGYCVDVLEHIPEEKVDAVLNNILRAGRHVFIGVSTVADKCGALIGERLHMTVKPAGWWMEKLRERDCLFHWTQTTDGGLYAYVTAWVTGRDVLKTGVLNEQEETIRAQVRHNTAAGWQQVHPHGTNDVECVVLGGGPSALALMDEIKERRADGAKLITLNGAYNLALDHGLRPSAQIIVDARPFNARFTKPVVDECRYLLASQCHPSVFDGLPPDRTWLFHSMAGLVGDILDERYGKGGWHPVPGGSTVLLRAIPLMRMLGYRRFHLYGCDSSLLGDRHHAYEQAENDGAPLINVTFANSPRAFRCTGWMISQAQEFMDLIRAIGDVLERHHERNHHPLPGRSENDEGCILHHDRDRRQAPIHDDRDRLQRRRRMACSGACDYAWPGILERCRSARHCCQSVMTRDRLAC